MRDKYNLNTLPPSLAGLEDYEMDEHVVIPGMGGMNEERPEFGEHQLTANDPPLINNHNQLIATESVVTLNENAVIPGLDLDVSTSRDKKLPYKKPPPSNNAQSTSNNNVDDKSEEFYGITAHDPASILSCVRDVVKSLVAQIPGKVLLKDLNPQKIQIYGKEIDVLRKYLKSKIS